MAEYANVIVGISLEKLDRIFQYKIPDRLKQEISVGMQVDIPFGNRNIKGYVVELTDLAEYEIAKLKEISGIVKESIPITSQMIALAAWMKKNYGGTMNQALKTVLPVSQKKKAKEQKTLRLLITGTEAKNLLEEYRRKHNTARERLLRALLVSGVLSWEDAVKKLSVSGSVIKALQEAGILVIESACVYRNPVSHLVREEYGVSLNEEQLGAVESVMKDYRRGCCGTYLLKGVTGSGKTEVYMELIARVTKERRQAIVLIPEIALTYQTVMRFYRRFGDRVSIMNSRLSQGERYDQFERAKNGEIDIMIGPRSALFTPFAHLGLIIIDEEHEMSYKSEKVPRYHARETAIARAEMAGAIVVLGSATPSVESSYRARNGEYRLIELTKRVNLRPLATCEVVDLRQELRQGNRSILSRRLYGLMEERLKKKQQIILFLNRRGIAGFVSCRACGHVIKCPHCDVSLGQHGGGRMVCHYCGYEEREPVVCPSCGSPYISGFKAGTEKVEALVKRAFPTARVLRMDMDTTRGKDSYERILSSFANQEADILVGTQMIVKGHDFANVTLVGVLAADLSLHIGDYHASERTFQLLTQAAGRAGRGDLPGDAVIQTYDPDHYCIRAACRQDYESFYRREIEYRKIMYYPPVWNLLVILCASKEESAAGYGAECLAGLIGGDGRGGREFAGKKIYLIGPAAAAVAKVNDIYKKVIYIKAENYQTLVALKDMCERFVRDNRDYRNVSVQFDFNPVSGF